MRPAVAATLLPFPTASEVEIPATVSVSLARTLVQTELYLDWARQLDKKVAAFDLTENTAKQYRAVGLHFFSFVARTEIDVATLQRCFDAAEPEVRLNRELKSALSGIDLKVVLSHFKDVSEETGKQAACTARSVLVIHLLPWLKRTEVSDFDPKHYSRRDFRLENSLDDHIVRRNEFVQQWDKAMIAADEYSSDTQTNYRRAVWRYCRYLRNNYLDKTDRQAIEAGTLHPAQALNDLITKNPFERVQAFLKGLDSEEGERARSVLLNHFYRYLNDHGRTRFNPASYPEGTFYPALPREERVVRESPILRAWEQHIMRDKDLVEGTADNYVRIVARYMAHVRDALLVKVSRDGEINFRPNVRQPERTFDRLIRRAGCEDRLVDFLGTIETDRMLASARWLLAERFYGWLSKQDDGSSFSREKFDLKMAA